MPGIEEHLEKADISFDLYHVVQQLGIAVDEVRRPERRDRAELTRTRYIGLKRPDNLTKRHQETLAWLNPPLASACDRAPFSPAPRFRCLLRASRARRVLPRPLVQGRQALTLEAHRGLRYMVGPTGTASSDATPPRSQTVFWRASTR